MDSRARRVGRNEALFRQINEELETRSRELAGISDRQLHLVCECGDLLCKARVAVPVAEYEEIRADPTLFFVKLGHDIPDVEEVVATRSSGYAVVRKRAAEAVQIAAATDPRSQ